MIERCLFSASTETKMIAFNTVVWPVLAYASQVWSPYIKTLTEKVTTVQRRLLSGRTDSVLWRQYRTWRKKKTPKFELSKKLWIWFIWNTIYWLDFFNTSDSTHHFFNTSDSTHQETLDPHLGLDQLRTFSFYNRMRPILEGQEPGSLMQSNILLFLYH